MNLDELDSQWKIYVFQFTTLCNTKIQNLRFWMPNWNEKQILRFENVLQRKDLRRSISIHCSKAKLCYLCNFCAFQSDEPPHNSADQTKRRVLFDSFDDCDKISSCSCFESVLSSKAFQTPQKTKRQGKGKSVKKSCVQLPSSSKGTLRHTV